MNANKISTKDKTFGRKRIGKIKGRVGADGQKQWGCIGIEDLASPIVSLNAFLVMVANKNRRIIVIDLDTFLHVNKDEDVHMDLKGNTCVSNGTG